MRCIAGLGNPGSEYARTRHNVGFMVVDTLAGRHGISLGTRRHEALHGRGVIGGLDVVLGQPQTFMNHSGSAIRRLLAYYGLEPKHLLVICDDINLDLGVLRLRRTGSHGGQKGLRSVARMLGTQDYARLRIGIGRVPAGRDATAYVLSSFRAVERAAAEDAIRRASDAVECALEHGLEEAMNRYNG
jgi:PTH1 family peptidyl-tRNA hydrolase